MELITLAAIVPLLAVLVALGLDRLFGEPRLHPLVAFGRLAAFIEARLNNRHSHSRGALALLFAVAPPVALIGYVQMMDLASLSRWVLDTMVLYLCIGWQSMKEHVHAIRAPLTANDLAQAKIRLARIVSRDTATMDATQITGSTLESLLENANDCLFATLFWYALLGPAGAIGHRLINTLDAMWGYRNERYRAFGCWAARADDLLGWFPARLSAILYALSGNPRTALTAAYRIRGNHKSPNAGLVMATGAGALGITIGGPVHYAGKLEAKPFIGQGRKAVPADIDRAIRLIHKSLLLGLLLYSLFVVFGVS